MEIMHYKTKHVVSLNYTPELYPYYYIRFRGSWTFENLSNSMFSSHIDGTQKKKKTIECKKKEKKSLIIYLKSV